MDANLEWLALVGVVNSVISAYYYLRVVKVMYLSTPPTDERIPSGTPIRLALLSSFVGLIVFGIYPLPVLDLARRAALVLVS